MPNFDGLPIDQGCDGCPEGCSDCTALEPEPDEEDLTLPISVFCLGCQQSYPSLAEMQVHECNQNQQECA